MVLSWIDWSIVIFVVALMFGSAWYAKRYVRGTTDFLAANRLAGKYLLTVSEGATGAIGTIATWQMIFCAGLSTQWWGMMSMPLGLFIALTGYVTFRLRETRALTLAQFFEVRYSRSFRRFSGALCWLSGLLNYGAFPAVAGKLFVALLGLPDFVMILGFRVPTYALTMLAYLVIAIYIACAGGQIALIISDFLQESFCKIVLIGLVVFLLMKFSWTDIADGLFNSPPGQSMIDPFDSSKVKGFNIWYFLIGLYGSIYSCRAWQGNSGYNAAAKTPHDAQMANIFSRWRNLLKDISVILPPVVAYVILTSPVFRETAAPIIERLNQIGDPQVRTQLSTPIAIGYILPVGFLGMLAAMFISGVISVDDTYIHAWGSIFIQDVVMPWRKEPFSPKTHMLLLRLAMVGVALFGFIFGLVFPFKDAILMFFALTGAIYLGGAGATIVGGLYWKRGTTAGAFAAMIVGTILAFGGMLVEQSWARWLCPKLLEIFPQNPLLLAHQEKFFLNGQMVYFIAMMTATVTYIIVSLLTGRGKVYDLDKLLHRGKYAIAEEKPAEKSEPEFTGMRKFLAKIGMGRNFTRIDKIIFIASFLWTMSWWLVFVFVTLYGTMFKIEKTFWSAFWHFKIWLWVVVGIAITIWLVAGGFHDLILMFRDLRKSKLSESDDGFVPEQEQKS